MCRHTAWLGRPRTLADLVVDPPYGLLRQSWQPRRQRYGTVNADGFGVGWYSPERPEPARYRRAGPIWQDRSFLSLAGHVRSGCVLAAVRSATAGTPCGEEACAPFHLGRDVLLSHNGAVALDAVAPLVTASDLARVGSTGDGAFVAALVASRLDGGLPAALAGAVAAVAEVAPRARLNLLATDGRTVSATAWGDTLWWRAGDGGAVVASEPDDDEPGWVEVADHSLLTLTGDGCSVSSLAEPEGPV